MSTTDYMYKHLLDRVNNPLIRTEEERDHHILFAKNSSEPCGYVIDESIGYENWFIDLYRSVTGETPKPQRVQTLYEAESIMSKLVADVVKAMI